MANAHDPPLDVELHLRYWAMCFRAPLPHHYLGNESNRMALAYFMVSSVDLLTPPDHPKPILPAAERPRLREWILAHQHASGGFCGSPSLVLPVGEHRGWDFANQTPEPDKSGHANLASTAFALQLLAILADDDTAASAYAGVDRARTLGWLRRLQREDGSFGETLVELPGRGWFVGGGYDMRYSYLAAMVRWILRGDVQPGDDAWVEDFDTGKMVEYIKNTQVRLHGSTSTWCPPN
jgi:geranylgeranyl transferase type-1 subunit beta